MYQVRKWTLGLIILLQRVALLIIPASAFAVARPDFRVEVFRHTGDCGMNPPHDWSGDVEPPVSLGLMKLQF